MNAGDSMARPRGTARLAGGLLLVAGIATAALGQSARIPPPVEPAPQQLPPPRPAPEGARTSSPATLEFKELELPDAPKVPINMPTALRLAQTANLDIAQAREVVNQARAAEQLAHVGWIPNFNIGSTYTHHEGNIQKTEGNIIKANKDGLFVGGGPSLNWSLADVYFGPLVARQVEAATQAGLQRVNNTTVLAVADAYLNVLLARRRLARTGETLLYLTAEQFTVEGQRFKGMLRMMRDFVEVGAQEALRSELARVEVEVLRRQEEQRAALQDFQTATAELARLLRLDPQVGLMPVEDFRFPIPLPGEELASRPVEQLVAFALAGRPELAENRALVLAALARVRNSKFRPLLPNVALAYNWGDFGGSPDPNPGGRPGFGPSGEIKHMNTRTDLDVSLVWRLRNFGFGDLADRRGFEAAYRQANLRQLQVEDLVVAQVVIAKEEMEGWRDRLNTTRAALFNANGAPAGPVFSSLRLNFERIRAAGGRPLEVLDSIRGLSDALEAYGVDVTSYERARFRLLFALGVPPQSLFDPSATQPAGTAANPAPGPNH